MVTGAFPEINTGGGGEQVGGSFAPLGKLPPMHSRVTLPEKPFVGVTVMAEVPLAPGVAMLTGVLVSEKRAGTTVRDKSAEVLPP
jgi:hypothetical protein